MTRKFLGGFLVVISLSSFLIRASIDSDTIKKQSSIAFGRECDICRDQMGNFNDYMQDLTIAIPSLPDAVYYNGLQHMCDVEKLFEDYEKERIDIIYTLGKLSKKLFGAPSQEEISKQKKETLKLLQDHKSTVEKAQKTYRYCDECKKNSFDDYNKCNELVSGYRYLEEISQMSEVLQDKTDAQLPGQLSSTQKHYVNLLHWMHHRLEKNGMYQYIKGLKPVSFMYNGSNVHVVDWNILHICMGDIKNGRLSGVHTENKDLFTHFYDRKQNEVWVRSDDKLRKFSTFFSHKWDVQACVKKAHEALQNINKIESGDQHGPGNIIVHGVTQDSEKIIIVVDPARKSAISFYPEK